jgi:predicted dehydrogenase
MSKIARVGVVGCGEVSQTIHLPTLRDLSDLFEVVALCDVSGRVLDRIGAQWPSAKRFGDHKSLVRDSGVDAVLIANPHVYHAEVALDAMAAGKHVLVEKPMCVNLREAEALINQESQSGVVAQVGFMRRYAPAFTEAVERVAGIRNDIILARVHDVIGSNQMIIDSTSSVFRDPEGIAALTIKAKADMAEAVRLAIGAQSPEKSRAYELLLGLSSHDVSAMRELLGRPKRVLSATQRLGGRALTAAFDYGHYVGQFETAVDRVPHFDAHIEVYTESEIFRVDYDTPYIRHLPAKLSVTGTHGSAGIAHSSAFPTRYDSFGVEWRAFHKNVMSGSKPKTSISDAREDLEIFSDMISLME